MKYQSTKVYSSKLLTPCKTRKPILLFVAVDGCNELYADHMWTYLIVCVGTYCTAVASTFCNVYFCGFHILQCVFLRVVATWVFFYTARLRKSPCSIFSLFCCCEHPLSYVRVNLCSIFLGIVVISGALTSWFSLAYVVIICLCLVHFFFFENVSFFSLSYSWPLFWTSH